MIDGEKSVFEAGNIRLGAYDFEKDPQVEAPWTATLDYGDRLRSFPRHPMLPAQVKKLREEQGKEQEKKEAFNFAVRLKRDDRLIGYARVQWIHWPFGEGALDFAIGDPEERGRHEDDLLALLLAYAFDELNLFRVRVNTPEYDRHLVECLERAGLTLEVRRREAAYRDGQPWDLLNYGMLAEEFHRNHREVTA